MSQSIATLVFGTLLSDLVWINIGVNLLRPPMRISRYCRAPMARTQREMNRLYVADADIYLARRLQLVVKFVVTCLIFSPAMPASWWVTALFLWLSQGIDRINLLGQLAPPPRSPDQLVATTLRFILPFALLARLCANFRLLA